MFDACFVRYSFGIESSGNGDEWVWAGNGRIGKVLIAGRKKAGVRSQPILSRNELGYIEAKLAAGDLPSWLFRHGNVSE